MKSTETMQIAAGFVPVNLATAANPGDWFAMKNYDRLLIVFFKGAGTAGEDPTITLSQATTNTGTGTKALNFTRIDLKQGADLQTIGQFTTVTQAAANTYTNDTLAETQAIICIEILAQDLDVQNGFDFVQASVSDVGTNSQIGCVLYIGFDARYKERPMPSALG